MNDISEYAVLVLTAGHCNEKSCVALNYLDIVNSDLVVHGDGDNGSETAVGN